MSLSRSTQLSGNNISKLENNFFLRLGCSSDGAGLEGIPDSRTHMVAMSAESMLSGSSSCLRIGLTESWHQKTRLPVKKQR